MNCPKTPYNYRVPQLRDDGLKVGHLNQQGINKARIRAMMQAILQGRYINTDSVLLLRNGVVVLDELLRSHTDQLDALVGNENLEIHSVNSVSKSVMSLLLGIAIDRGHIKSVDEPIWSYYNPKGILHWDARKAAITIADLLTTRHGFKWQEWSDADRHYHDMDRVFDKYNDLVKGTLDLPMATAPGQISNYCSMTPLVLGTLVKNACGIPLAEFAEQALFAPLGISKYQWLTTPDGQPNVSWGLYLGSRDMAKLGQLMLQQGQWQTRQIVSKAWIKQSTCKHIYVEDHWGASDYGYLWWVEDYLRGEQRLPFYHADGNGGQFIFVVPDRRAVAVFTGSNYDSPLFMQANQIMAEYILPALSRTSAK